MSSSLDQGIALQTGDLPNRGGKLIIPEIDGLRGIAVLGVIFAHTFADSLSRMRLHLFGLWMSPYFVGGWLGVNLFFVLSAFVLFLPYVAGKRDIHAPGAFWRFYRRRALRLLPAYYLIVAAEMSFSGYSPFGNADLTQETLGVLSFTFPFMPSHWMPVVNTPIWSLGTEVLFSAGFPLLCWLCLRFGALRILAVSIPAGLCVRLWGFYLGGPTPVSWLEGMMVGRIDEFLWGFFLAEAFVQGRFPKRPGVLWITGTVILAAVLTGYAYSHFSQYHHLLLSSFVIIVDVTIALFVAAALAGRSWWSGFLRMRWLRVIGMACYSIYLWHAPLVSLFHIPADPWNVAHVAGFLLFLCILSAITYRFVEFRNVADWRPLFLVPGGRGPLHGQITVPAGFTSRR